MAERAGYVCACAIGIQTKMAARMKRWTNIEVRSVKSFTACTVLYREFNGSLLTDAVIILNDNVTPHTQPNRSNNGCSDMSVRCRSIPYTVPTW